MAAIGKIRSWGPVLVIILGVVLFFFIAEPFGDFIRSRSAASGQVVGKVLGDNLDIQSYQTLVEEYQGLLKLQGRDNLGEDEMNSLRDYIWQNYVQNKIVEAEAEKLGLTVTDQELAAILQDGTHAVLSQTPLISEFVNPQTRKFDLNQVTSYREALKQNASIDPRYSEQSVLFERVWQFAEKTLRQQLLMNKFQTLLGGCVMSNPVSAKAAFDAQNVESKILLASLPYSTINDNDVEPTDAEVKAKYDEEKNRFKTYQETRDIKYVAYKVVASEADRAELMAQMKEAEAMFRQDSLGINEIVRSAQSQVAYLGLPLTRAALPNDIAARVDSMSVGQVSEPFETRSDNTLNVVKVLSKPLQPDSIEFCAITLVGRAADAAAKSADSIMTALKAGVPFDSIAKNYGQSGDKIWLTSAQYQSMQNIDADNKAYFNALLSMGQNELRNLKLSAGNVIVKVTDRRAPVQKYDVAIVKRTINFSNDTYTQAFNNFSQYVSENQTLEGLQEHAADYGYTVVDRTVANNVHNIANIHGTHDALKWAFNEAKPGNVSQVYDRCGNNDYLVVVALDKVNPEGFQGLDAVKDAMKQEVLRDKKFAQLQEKLKNAKSVAEAQQAGAKVDTVQFITFRAPVFVQAVGMPEAALSGAVAGTEKGAFSKNVVKGNGGAYVFQVLDRTNREGVQFDATSEEKQLRQQSMQQVLGLAFQELQNKAKVVDNRYLFF